MSRRSLSILAGGVLALVLAIVAVATLNLSPGGKSGGGTGTADIGGAFTLVGEDGETVTEADFRGKPTAIFFGFTFCPDVCPTTLFELSGLIEALGPDADKLNYAFVSVDWERDGPEDLARYTSSFDDRIKGLSGTQEQIESVTQAYRVYYKKVPTAEGEYTIDHTASVYLMDADGGFVGTLSYGEAHDSMLEKLKRLAANG
ncbi:SCO family protein [Nitratireductor kimnyeongensis]|uniref:SCO family protein n=1 Tax=Nitratireductor kimnyeongensis TaxID=430679 RepID=A0ABW0TDI2_9HYPH|nr:SCO family protein [Nitratireductor kimnyeongensis]QZZ37719.1 SCO family protein [Nitratireductor kimnyeongensis]